MTHVIDLRLLLKRLAARSKTRTEADVQSDIKLLLTTAHLNLAQDDIVALEVPVRDGTRRRIDIEVGNLVIEVKRDLRKSGIIEEATPQLAGYILAKGERLNSRYLGLLTDGAEWRLYHLVDGDLLLVARFMLDSQNPNVDELTIWLESILATEEDLVPTPGAIEQKLGSSSPSYLLDHATLLEMYRKGEGNAEILVKRELWAKLLRTALGSAFKNDETLFVDHTLLVLSAELIAHAVVGYDLRDPKLSPATLVRGEAFSGSQIYGVVEADFFDWVLNVPGGKSFILSLAKRLARFHWKNVEHDVLKTLYQSIIDPQTRHDLGEYYTPDWLAEKMVSEAIDDPQNQRILDPACGSGTFLFHAVRRYLEAASTARIENGPALAQLTRQIIGVDAHPVSVTLARVTYLLAIGTDRLTAHDRGPLPIPVYLGDSVQWDQHMGYLSQGEVCIPTTGTDLAEGDESTLFGKDDLVFPAGVLEEAGDFDRLVSSLADKAITYQGGEKYPDINPIFNRFGIAESDRSTLRETFETMCRLHADGRNHIWSYYVRNLIRPLWLAEEKHAVDVVIGNPPWLAYRYMTSAMQRRFKKLAGARGLLAGRLGVSSRDLSALFVCRAVELYLKNGGRFSFVMPRATLSRRQYSGFRTGRWSSIGTSNLNVSFEESWDLGEVRPHLFPVPSAVIHGKYTPRKPTPLVGKVKVCKGKLPRTTVSLAVAEEKLSWSEGEVRQITGSDSDQVVSPYKGRFRQGAVLAPQFLLLGTTSSAGPLGAGAGRVSLQSRRSVHEDKRWKHLPGLSGNIEIQFARPTYLGQSIFPYQAARPVRSILPVSKSRLLTSSEIEEYGGLSEWWERAEELWNANKVKGDKSSLLERIDFHGQLSSQLSTGSHRVVYTKAGNRLAAARIMDTSAIIDFSLYWGSAASTKEALYLIALLNSETVLNIVSKYQAQGQFGARHFDKYVWNVPIPEFDIDNVQQVRLADLAVEAESAVLALDIPPNIGFQRARKLVRDKLVRVGIAKAIENECRKLLGIGD